MDDIRTLFLLFVLYSFLGWVCESIYCSIPAGRFVNRGFLNGPFCPIYGAGAMLVVTVLNPLRGNAILLFFAGLLLTSAVEYLTGFLLEVLFHAKYWDYSRYRFNLQGRVCLKNSVLFGVMGVAAVYFVQPLFLRLAETLPKSAVTFLSAGLAAYFLGDTALTVVEITRLNGKLGELQQVLDEIKEKALTAKVETLEALQETIESRLDESTKERLAALYERKERLESNFHLLQRRIIRAFPTMRPVRNIESLQRIRELMQNYGKFFRRG